MIRKVKSHNNVRCAAGPVDIGYISTITPITQQIECNSMYNNTKEYVSCVMAPMLEAQEEIAPPKLFTRVYRNYWYEMSEYCNKIRERYMSTLSRVRKRRKSATF
jgi:hypothetical protein